MPIDLTKIRKKINPEPDGQDVLRLKTAVVSGYNSTNGVVDIVMNGATLTNIPVLSGAALATGVSVQVLSYRGSLLVLGISGNGAQPVQLTGSTTLGSTTSTSYTNSLTTTGVHGIAFIGPPSGKVQVFGRAMGGNSTVGQYAQLDWEVRQGSTAGSGTVVRTTSDNTASVFLSSTSGGQGPLNISGLVTGLTPGSVYNATLTYAASGGTANFNRRYVAVYPL